MSTKLLISTVFEGSYSLFGVEDDRSLVMRMSQIGLIYTILTGLYGLLKAAPYGKHSTNNTGISSWIFGPPVNAKIAWVIQESPSWIVPAILMHQSKCIHFGNTPNLILTVVFMAHYIQRSLIYPFRMSQTAKGVPLVICANAFIFCLYNGLLQTHFLLNVQMVNGSSPFFFTGVVLFIIGMVINIHHDGILLSLRQTSQGSSSGSDDRTHYKIPRGFLFEYVSGANYSGEILEWWGFGIASAGFPQFLFAIFSTVFLGLRAWHGHNFYHRTFGKSYPSSRKALIPFIL